MEDVNEYYIRRFIGSSSGVHIGGAALPETLNGNKIWWYRDVDGTVQYGVMRIDDAGTKKFFPVVLKSESEAVQIPHWPAGKVLFNANNLAQYDKVIVVEGEKTAEKAAAYFKASTVVTWRGGAKNINTGNWDLLKGKKVWLWPDNDEPGHAAMAKIAELLTDSEVRLCDVSWVSRAGDLGDDLPVDKVISTVRDAKLLRKPEVLHSTLADLDAQEELLSHQFKLGWEAVDNEVKLPSSGVVVIEGRTGHAKTGASIAVMANHLRSGGRAYYFSYEIPARRVFGRLVRSYNSSFTSATTLRGTPEWDSVAGWVSDGRLKLFDKQLDLVKLNTILESVEAGSLIVIDYAQIVPVKGSDTRAKIIELMDTLRIQSNARGFLVLLLSQVTPDYQNPLHDAPRDAKDIHMSAEVVLRVWNKDQSWYHPIYDEVPGNLIMHVLKNRDSEGGQMIGFSFKSGTYLEPNGHILQAGAPPKQKDRSATALETIAAILQTHLGEI
jgi:5S rRNA maturation endonuclease (ribonuclease M5)